MIRPTLSLLMVLSVLTSCDKLAPAGAAAPGREKKRVKIVGERPVTTAEEVKVSSNTLPEIVAAFEAISKATREHNRVLIENIEGDGPVNELSFTAGLILLDRSAREHSGLAKQIIDAVATTTAYQKSLFVPFDTIRRQVKGMDTWSTDQAVQRRGYIQIIDSQIATYDHAISYLERGEEPLLRQNFQRQRVPAEAVEEFLRLRLLRDKAITENNEEMFREERAALQSYRDAMATTNPAAAKEHLAQASQHEEKAKAAQSKMVAGIKEKLGDSKPL